ncbi:hypothetical protein [Sphingomonas faeni]|uniref:hypothetical protein n=1 Tax=Sphingomonas faeni TaxID=185950 RepID=UPI00277D35E4|nr:hypothetical protein [Sphingomonas faeni]MDQ0839842.1 hypothetical protein [Sphingomonas faeni]
MSLHLDRMQDSNLRLLQLIGATQRGKFFFMRLQLRHGRDVHGAQSVRIKRKISLDQRCGAMY